jgi:hypothetical protein
MPTNRLEPIIVPKSSKMAERLLAHARLCRQIAEQSWNEETAQRLDTLAQECVRAAAELTTDADDAHAQEHLRSSD